MRLRSLVSGPMGFALKLFLALHLLVPFAFGVLVAVSGDLTLEGPSGPGFWMPVLANSLFLAILTTIEIRALQWQPLGELSSLILDVVAGVLLSWIGLVAFTAGLFTPYLTGWGELGLDDLCGQYTLEGCDAADEDLGGAMFSWLLAAGYLSVLLGLITGATGWFAKSFRGR